MTSVSGNTKVEAIVKCLW